MKLLRYLLPIAVAACGLVSTKGFAYFHSESHTFNETELDFDGISNFVKTKRMIPLREKACDLHLSGSIRPSWSNIFEKHEGHRRRGQDTACRNRDVWRGAQIPRNEFDLLVRLNLDYKGECTWAVMELEFDADGGIVTRSKCCPEFFRCCRHKDGIRVIPADPHGGKGSGTFGDVRVRTAFFGYNIFEECNSRLDVEVGRRVLNDLFDSYVQFKQQMDGFALRYSNAFECVGDFYVTFGAFVVDENVDHYGFALETGLLDICDYGFDVKYSLIDWRASKKFNRCHVKDPIGERFLVHQFTGAYHLNPEWLCAPAQIYGALLWNSDAKKIDFLDFDDEEGHHRDGRDSRDDRDSRDHHRRHHHDKKANFGGYVGFMVGKVRCEGDWFVDVRYEYVGAQTIPDFDVAGIGRGNGFDYPITVSPEFGNTNYQGIRVAGLYALTDNLSVNPVYSYSLAADKKIGGRNNFGKWKLQFIYSF